MFELSFTLKTRIKDSFLERLAIISDIRKSQNVHICYMYIQLKGYVHLKTVYPET